ncbi:MAG TPA: polysaccharide ABC transporter ATP-binding protein [Pyrinomonadaceae bacterium]|nr:polysaccharide ABC transporter ATP-binding protein [Pyrinomonadaceae bacterium]
MSSDIAIRCEGLSKRYRIGKTDSYRTLRDVIADAAAAPFRRLRRTVSSNGNGNLADSIEPTANSIWALNDVSLEINRGDVVGIIGRNGAGKSTLLKILSRITKPTRGHADINGRVGSLLEVGTGFHPELTGRENIYLNGAILGMHKAEIDRKFDEIVAFAEVEQFIDTPVKRYSSGMYVRLAFAVAAHMETEILLVDEVLAVGDAQFQKKCFSKMSQIRNQGKTIVLVSHNMAAVRNICNQGLHLQHGHAVLQAEINQVVDAYLAGTEEAAEGPMEVETENFVVNEVLIESSSSPILKTFAPCEIRVRFQPKIDVGDPGVYIGFLTKELHRLAGLDLKDFTSLPPLRAGQSAEIGFSLESLPFLAGSYRVEVHLKDMSRPLIERVPRYYRFDVAETPVYGGRHLDSWFGNVGLTATPIARV